MLSTYADVLAALRDQGAFASGYSTRIPDNGDGRIVPLDYDPLLLHTEYRKLFSEWVTPRTVHGIADEIRPRRRHYGGGRATGPVAMPLRFRPVD